MARKNIKQQIIQEIQFFRDYPGFPNLSPQIGEDGKPGKVDPVSKRQFDALVEAFEGRASSPAHLAKIAKALQGSMTFCPKPPDVHQAADLVAERGTVRDWDPETPKCPHGECDGTGFVRTKLDVDGVSVAGFCRCHAAYKSPKGATHAATAERS